MPLPEGFEEIEAVTVIDVLRRADIEVFTAGLVSTVVEGSHKIKMMTDGRLPDVSSEDFDVMVLPGGDPGYKNLSNSSRVMEMIKDFDRKKKIIGAICAAPMVLVKAGILDDKKATVFPTMERYIPKIGKGKVIVDKNIITSQAPGTAMDFALKLVEILAGKEKADRLRLQLVFDKEDA